MKFTGQVLDYKTDQPLPSASVTVIDKNGATLTGQTADSEGKFIIESSALDNPYNKVIFSYVGYQPETIIPSPGFQGIYLVKAGETLSPVEVVAKIAKSNKKEIIKIILQSVLAIVFMAIAAKLFKL
jgi:hypothetical protein